MTNLSFLSVGVPANSRLLYRPIFPQDIVTVTTPATGGTGGRVSRKRDFLEPDLLPVVVHGHMLSYEYGGDEVEIIGDVQETETQKRARLRRQKALRVLLFTS